MAAQLRVIEAGLEVHCLFYAMISVEEAAITINQRFIMINQSTLPLLRLRSRHAGGSHLLKHIMLYKSWPAVHRGKDLLHSMHSTKNGGALTSSVQIASRLEN